MENRDPFDILSENNPINPSSIDAYGAEADQLLQSILGEPTRSRPRRLRRTLYVGIAAAMILATTAAAWVLSVREVETLSVVCFESVDLDGNRSGLSETATPRPESCEQPFEDGRLTFDVSRPGFIPPLTGCVSDGGSLYVFPTDNDNICATLGLAEPDPDQPTDALDRIGAAKQQITDFMLQSDCRPIEATVIEVRRILDRNELTAWTIDRRSARTGQNCGSIAYDLPNETVIVVPIEPAP